MAENKKEWYVLRAISGKEAKVKEVIEAQMKNTDLGRYVSQVLIPTEKVLTQRNGKKVVKERTLYSGYVFIEAELTGEVQYELRNTTNVIDFLRGRAKGAQPESLRESEVMRMLGVADEMRQPLEGHRRSVLRLLGCSQGSQCREVQGEGGGQNFWPSHGPRVGIFSGGEGVVSDAGLLRMVSLVSYANHL